MQKSIFAAACAGAMMVGASYADKEKESSKWDVSAPPYETRDVPIDVTEGTWMSLDVSPDGKTIAFDLLGDIYTIPMSGGEATPIASGIAWDIQPRFSPDGSKLAFTSDRGGGDNIWIMNADGSDKRQVTKEKFRLLNNATWSPDGDYIAARKHYTTQRSLGVGEIWLYHVSGGDGVQLVKRPSEEHQKELGEPIFSPDGNYIYYTQNITPGSQFIYAQDSNTDLFNIRRYELATGEITTTISGAGGAVRAAPSPDGKTIAFVRRERIRTKLYLKDIKSGKVEKIYDDLDQDLQEVWAVHGVYPNMDWTPDGKHIVFWSGGKIRKLNVANKTVIDIPFRVKDSRAVASVPRPQVNVAPDSFTTTMPRFASLSPDGRNVVFESLGKLYVKSVSSGAPRRLTSADDGFEFFPSWSNDGRRIAYVAWTDAGLGQIRTVSASGGGSRDVTREPGHYRRPRFSPDGRVIVFEKGTGGFITDEDWSESPGVYVVPASGGAMTKVTDGGDDPHFGPDNGRIFYTSRTGTKALLKSVNLDGLDERTHASGELVTGYQVSRDGRHLAFTENYSAYVMPMTPGPLDVAASSGGSAFAVVKVSGEGATYVNWANEQLAWSLGPTLYSANLADALPAGPAGEEKPEPFKAPESGVDLSMSRKTDKPAGRIVLANARIITMASDDGAVIDNGYIAIDGNRIARIGAGAPPADLGKVVDMAGKTITPGFIDAHAHGAQGTDDIIPQQNWVATSHLMLGVTTVHDPSNRASHIFAAAEYQRAGLIKAPRLYSSGEVVYGAKSPRVYAVINSMDDARAHVRRLKKQGALSIKNYNQPRRDQRQQVIAAAREENIAVVAEGASLFHMDLAHVADGTTSVEHNLPQAKLYEDVLSFYSATESAYVPTLVVTYGGLAGDPYWRDNTDVWKHPILAQHAPPRILEASSVRRQKAPVEDYVDNVSAATSKQLADRGVEVAIGAHGQEEGLGSHWEMWSFVRGGMSPVEALRAATIAPARHLGLASDIGSIEDGKLADLVVLNANPLDDIGNTDEISHVMLNGRLYEAATMSEVETGDYKRAPYWWE